MPPVQQGLDEIFGLIDMVANGLSVENRGSRLDTLFAADAAATPDRVPA